MDCDNAKTRRDGDYFELQVVFGFSSSGFAFVVLYC